MSATGDSRSGWRRIVAQLAIFALLFQAGIFAFHLSAIAGAPSGSLPPGAVLICSQNGPIVVDADGNPAPHSQPAKPSLCPLCQLLSATSLHTPPDDFIPVRFPRAAEWLEAHPAAIPAAATLAQPRSRGPPALLA